MRTLKLHDGTDFPAFGLGTWLAPADEVYRAVRHAIELGYRHIDAAWIYLNEKAVGRAIGEAIDAGDVTREALWVTTKLWNDHHAPEHVRVGLERSLAHLGLDYVDLYLVHWPVAHRYGVQAPEDVSEFVSLKELPLAATWGAMAELPATGLTRQIGVSNFSASKIDAVSQAVGVIPAVNQVEMHPFLQQRELLKFLQQREIAAMAYSPIGSAGRPASLRGAHEEHLLTHPTVVQLAEARGATAAQILIAWALTRGTGAIPKSTSPTRLRENLAATSLSLTHDELGSLAQLDRGARYVSGAFWCPPGSPYTVAELWA